MKCLPGHKAALSLFSSHVLEPKSISNSHQTLSINPRKKKNGCGIDNLKIRFKNLCSIIIYIFAQGYELLKCEFMIMITIH